MISTLQWLIATSNKRRRLLIISAVISQLKNLKHLFNKPSKFPQTQTLERVAFLLRVLLLFKLLWLTSLEPSTRILNSSSSKSQNFSTDLLMNSIFKTNRVRNALMEIMRVGAVDSKMLQVLTRVVTNLCKEAAPRPLQELAILSIRVVAKHLIKEETLEASLTRSKDSSRTMSRKED